MKRVKTAIIAIAGVAAFHLAGLPLPFLFGPMAACLIAALGGVSLKGAGQIGVAARTILGVAVGASITPQLLGNLPDMAVTLAIVPIYIGVIAIVGVPFFARVCGFDRATAYYAAMPGGLQDMVIFGQEAGGDVRALSLIHATRVLVIVTVAPILLVGIMDGTLSNPIGVPAVDLPGHEMMLMVLAALIGWKGGEKIGLFGASILGPMIATAILSLAGFLHHRPPAEAILTAQFFIGLTIGTYYVGITLRELRHDVLAGVAYVFVLAGLAAVVTLIVSNLGLSPALETFLAFAPGGQAEMAVLAIVSGADLGFVVLHHILRIVLVITGAPILARFVFEQARNQD